jgi:hypothetical protein
MSRIKRPSPALVVAILALVAALVVPAAAQVAITALTKKEKRVVRKISRVQANKQITRRAPGLDVSNSRTTDEVRHSGRVVLNDPAPGALPNPSAELLAAGPFTVRGQCAENVAGGSDEFATVIVQAPAGSSFTGRVAGPAGTGFDLSLESEQSAGHTTQSSGNEVTGAHVTVVAPGGEVWSVQTSAEVNDPVGDCVFGVTAVGP